jgi:hypothetical protein
MDSPNRLNHTFFSFLPEFFLQELPSTSDYQYRAGTPGEIYRYRYVY